MVVKTPGEFKIEFQSDYILVVEPEIPEVNIEYCLVKKIKIDATSFPARPAIPKPFKLLKSFFL